MAGPSRSSRESTEHLGEGQLAGDVRLPQPPDEPAERDAQVECRALDVRLVSHHG